jgi:glycosyltransferase involved in cell wall biosynthesis
MSLKISIVTPSFNQAGFVEETLRSVLDQGYPDLEYVVIDGGSTDGSVEIIEKYRDRLAYFVSEKDSGHGNALNKGFARTSGEVMAWLNSDDKYCPWTFQAVAQIFEAYPDIQWLAGLHGTWNVHGTLLGTDVNYKNVHDFLNGNYGWIQQETVFWRRALWEKAGGYINEDYKLMVDGELWTRFFPEADLWHAICVLGGYRAHRANRAMQFRRECDEEMIRAITAMHPRLTPEVLRQRAKDYPFINFDRQRESWARGRLPRVR